MSLLNLEIYSPLLDAVVHWSICRSVLAVEQFTIWGGTPLRDFCLEIIGKLTIREKNIRLLVSAISEEKFRIFVKVISGLINVREETHIRFIVNFELFHS